MPSAGGRKGFVFSVLSFIYLFLFDHNHISPFGPTFFAEEILACTNEVTFCPCHIHNDHVDRKKKHLLG